MEKTTNEFYFKTGVVVTFKDDSLNVKTSNFNSSINYTNLDNYTYSNIYKPRISPIGLAFRTLVFGWFSAFIIVLPVKDEWGALFFTASSMDIFLAWLSIIIAVGSVLIFWLILFGLGFSVFMETSFLSRFIQNNFSDYRIKTIIGNKSGNNIEYNALEEEISKVKAVEIEIASRKKIVNENTKSNSLNILQTDFHSDLKKLNELLVEGILTQEEYDLKKKQILGI